MRIALTQMDIVWEEKAQNRATCERLVREAAVKQAELIVFPEMTLTGFTMKPELYGEADGETEDFFKKLSRDYQIGIVFGYIENRNGEFYNMLELVDGGQTLMKYAKLHPFSYGEESRHYQGGSLIETACFRGITVGGFVCYDLRFPEIFQISSRKSQLIAVIANWPEARIAHWNALLKARAIENQCFILGVNRVGEGDGLYYPASSNVFTPYGDALVPEGDSGELIVVDADMELVEIYRREFPVKADRREDVYHREAVRYREES